MRHTYEGIDEADMDEALEGVASTFEYFIEEFECLRAESAPGTTCARWEREQAEEACYEREDGSHWNYEEEWCMSKEQTIEWNLSQCQDDEEGNAEWVPDKWGGYCDRTDLKISSNKPMLAFLKRSAAGNVQKRSALRHILSANSPLEEFFDRMRTTYGGIDEAVMKEAFEDMTVWYEEAMGELECLRAESASEPTCARWEREQAEEDCYEREDSSYWNYEEEWCMSEEQAIEYWRPRCQDDD